MAVHDAPNRPATIVWYRQDLRTSDHPALSIAASLGRVVPVFIWSPDEEGSWPLGGAAKVWLADSLRNLAAELADLGSRLIIRRGPVVSALIELIQQTGAGRVFCSRRYEPHGIAAEEAVRQALVPLERRLFAYPGTLLFEPGEIVSKSGKPFQVFTPFSRACLAQPALEEPLDPPERLDTVDPSLCSLSIDGLELEPQQNWPSRIRSAWQPGAAGANERLFRFVDQGLADYDACRDQLDVEGTSQLSPHLRWGEISPRQVWRAVRDLEGKASHKRGAGVSMFIRQLLWREFAYHLLVHFPQTDHQPLRSEFQNFPWCNNPAKLKSWRQGRTGYPLVDAGMRQLWLTGWMHNRVRMVVASFLVKHLLIPWQEGARWFWDTLVDADLANNTLGWQWTAGCGADAAPYFRIFNPVSQGQKFDPDGVYVRRWLPELSEMPPRWIHTPWQAPAELLAKAGVTLGKDYPPPIVDHAEARAAALAAFAQLKG